MSPAPISLRRLAEERAQGRCEYCRMHQSLQGATFHLEHIQPESHGGSPDLDNRAWCCPSCNLHKSDRTTAIDPQTHLPTPLFNPRRDVWSDHFQWDEFQLVGLTPKGRATVALLDLNHPRKLLIRQAEARFDLFPPP